MSRAEVFAALLPRLVRGYALDALALSEASPDAEAARAFLDEALGAPRRAAPTPGIGQGMQLTTERVVGGGLEHAGELVTLCAFPAGEAGR